MLVSKMIQNYREAINPPYNKKDIPTILATLFVLVALPLTVFAVVQSRDQLSRAARIPSFPANMGIVSASCDFRDPALYRCEPLKPGDTYRVVGSGFRPGINVHIVDEVPHLGTYYCGSSDGVTPLPFDPSAVLAQPQRVEFDVGPADTSGNMATWVYQASGVSSSNHTLHAYQILSGTKSTEMAMYSRWVCEHNVPEHLEDFPRERCYYYNPYKGAPYRPFNTASTTACPTADTTAPTVSLTSPANATNVATNTTVTLTASAADNLSGVYAVEFWANNSLLCLVKTAPYTCDFKTGHKAAAYSISVRAEDQEWNQSAATVPVLITAGSYTSTDSQAPSVSITSPTNGGSVAGIFSTITAAASDNVGVNRLDFYIDGVAVGSRFCNPCSWNWNADAVPLGSTHTILVKAYDSAGNVGTSTSISVVAGDTQPPSVSITSPANGATVSGTVYVSVTSTDNFRVNYITLYIDGQSFTSVFICCFTFTWSSTTVANGSHTLTAEARDAAGNIGTNSISVTVSN